MTTNANPLWRIVTLGYQGDHQGVSKTNAVEPLCTSTLIETGLRRVLIDPGFDEPDTFKFHLFARTGYRPSDIDTVFLTHFHPRHRASLVLFRKSVWLMSKVEINWWQKHQETSVDDHNLLARIVPIDDHPIPGIETILTPGHTHGSASLVFETREGIIVAAGDAIPTFDHFDDREAPEYAEDHHEARRSINRIAKMADIVIPGHDNFFVV